MSGGGELALTAERWAVKADNDLRNAEHTLLLEQDCPFDTVCFHAQQCAEKYLKALLIAKGTEPPRTHDLRLLLSKLPVTTASRFEVERLLVLNRYSVEARYPGDWEPITREEAQEAVELARTVRLAARQVLFPAQS
jgi:HEPN domain-containing protein